MHALSNEGFELEGELRDRLHSFRRYIPDMKVGLLTQFVRVANLSCITAHIKYFWKIGPLYLLLRDHTMGEGVDMKMMTDLLAHAPYLAEIR